MTRTSAKQLITLFVATLAVAWIALQLLVRQGIHLPSVTWHQPFAYLVIAGLVTWGGMTVRAYLAGKKPNLSGVTASRIATFAKACSLGGALFLGWYGVQILIALENFSVESQQSRALWAGIAAATAIVLAVCGMIAERNCQIPPEEPQEANGKIAGNPA